MTLKTTTTLPPGGWRYQQPETGYKHSSMGPFDSAVKEILEHRRGNNLPRASMNEVATDLEDYTCQRIGGDPAWCHDEKKKLLPDLGQQHQSQVAPPAARQPLSLAVNGAKILKDWLGDGGKPVAQALAQSRANACVYECSDLTRGGHDLNRPATFFQSITGAVAEAILLQRKVKTNLGLSVENEDKLQTCAVCTCHLRLKIWVPMDVLLKRTAPETMDQFPPHCWMVTENRRAIQSLSTTTTQPPEEE